MFTTELTVTIDHINYGHHLAHDKLITMLHEARLRFFDALGEKEFNFYGVGLIVKSLNVNYRKETFRGEVLKFIIYIDEIRGAGFSLNYEVMNEANELIADAQVVLVGFNNHSVVRLPEVGRKTLGQFQRLGNV